MFGCIAGSANRNRGERCFGLYLPRAGAVRSQSGLAMDKTSLAQGDSNDRQFHPQSNNVARHAKIASSIQDST